MKRIKFYFFLLIGVVCIYCQQDRDVKANASKIIKNAKIIYVGKVPPKTGYLLTWVQMIVKYEGEKVDSIYIPYFNKKDYPIYDSLLHYNIYYSIDTVVGVIGEMKPISVKRAKICDSIIVCKN